MSTILDPAQLERLQHRVVSARNLGLPALSLIVWLLPTLVGVPAIVIWPRYYRRRFEPEPGVPSEGRP